MSQVSELDKQRKKHMRIKTIKRVISVLVVSVIVFVLYALRFDIASQGVGVLLQDTLAMAFDNTGYPIELEFPPVQLTSVGKRAVVVSQGNLSVFNNAGNEVIKDRITNRNPIAVPAGGKMLLYSQGGRELSIHSGKMKLYQVETESPIYTAALSKNGICAFSTGAMGYQSQLNVLDSSYQSVFQWAAADSIIMALAVNDSGSHVAASGVFSDNGVISSSVMLFNMADGQQSFNLKLSDEIVTSIVAREDGGVITVSDCAVTSVSSKGEVENRYFFDGDPLAAFDLNNDGCVLALGRYSSSHEMRIVKLSASAQELASTRIARNVIGVNAYNGGMIAFTPEWAIHYSPKLEQLRMIETADASHRTVIGDSVYFTTARQLSRSPILK